MVLDVALRLVPAPLKLLSRSRGRDDSERERCTRFVRRVVVVRLKLVTRLPQRSRVSSPSPGSPALPPRALPWWCRPPCRTSPSRCRRFISHFFLVFHFNCSMRLVGLTADSSSPVLLDRVRTFPKLDALFRIHFTGAFLSSDGTSCGASSRCRNTGITCCFTLCCCRTFRSCLHLERG